MLTGFALYVNVLIMRVGGAGLGQGRRIGYEGCEVGCCVSKREEFYVGWGQAISSVEEG